MEDDARVRKPGQAVGSAPTPDAVPSAESATSPQGDDADLRSQVDELSRRNAELEARSGRRFSWSRFARATVAVVLITLGAVFITLAAPAIWGRNLVLNTDRYVETLAPLASDPGVQQAVVKAVDQQFDANVDLTSRVRSALPPRAADLLAGPIQSAASSLVNTIATRFVESAAFATLWSGINRVTHASLVAILTGNRSSNNALVVRDGTLFVDLGPVVDAVKARLVSAGLSVAQLVPTVGVTIELMQLKGLTKAQSSVRLLNKVAHWLPLLALVCFAGGILAARRRRRALMISALSAAAGMVVLGIGVLIGRQIYLNSLPLHYLTANDAGRIFDTLVRFLRYGLRIVFAVGLVICAIAWLTGPYRAARATRAHVVSGVRRATAVAANPRFAGFIAANRRVVSISVVALAALVLILWTNPGVATVLVIGIIAAAVVIVVYTFPHQPTSASTQAEPIP